MAVHGIVGAMRFGLYGMVALVLLVTAVPTAPVQARSPGERLARRTPPAEAWQVQRFSPTEYFGAAELRRWTGYRRSQRWASRVALGLELGLYLLLLLTRIPRRLLDGCLTLAARLGHRWPFSSGGPQRVGQGLTRIFGPDWHGALLFAFALYGVANLLHLPLALWQEHLAQQAGLSVYRPAAWAWDALKGLLFNGVLFAALVFGLYGLMRRFPRRWWLVLAVPAALVLVAYGYVEPEAPRMYHTLRPLNETRPAEREAGQRLRRLARRAGVTLSKIRVLHTSRTSRTLGAYVVGLGDRRELVIYDSLLREATPAELEAVVAHELGHEQHRSDGWTYGLASLALAALLWLMAVVLRRAGPWVGAQRAGDVITLPLLAFVLWLVFTLSGPLIAHRSRQQEREADRQGLVLTGDPDAFIRLQVRLARRNRAEVRPSAWVSFWRSHPSTYERIGTARWYGRWLHERGQKSRPRERSR